MIAKIFSSCVIGVEAHEVTVETDTGGGLPGINIVGLPDIAIKESRDRIKSAIKNSNFSFPTRKITINLAPADIKKEGSSFDLPIALSVLAAEGVTVQTVPAPLAVPPSLPELYEGMASQFKLPTRVALRVAHPDRG